MSANGWQISILQQASKKHGGKSLSFSMQQCYFYLGAQEEVEAQSAHGEELVVVHSEQAVEAEVPSLGRSS